MNPELGQVYLYVGPGHGRNEKHRVIMIEGGEVVTWGMTRMSWLGSVEEFSKHFVGVTE